MGDDIRELLRFAGIGVRRIHGHADPLGLLGIQLQRACHEGAVGFRAVAVKRVYQALAFGRRARRDWLRRIGFARPRHRHRIRHIQPERPRVAVRRIIRQRKPPRRQQQVHPILPNGCHANIRHRAVLFIYQKPSVAEGQRHGFADRHRLGKIYVDEEGIIVLALKRERFSVGGFDVPHIKILV